MQRYFMDRSKKEMQEYRENDAKIKKIVEERKRQEELCGLQQEKIRKDKEWDEGVKTYDLPDLIVRPRYLIPKITIVIKPPDGSIYYKGEVFEKVKESKSNQQMPPVISKI